MPDKTTNTAAPSQSFLSRMFGAAPQQISPEIQQGIDIARRERPDLASVQQYGPISRMLQGGPGNQGYTSPGGSIYLNPEIQQGPQEWADTIIHEQTHADQMKQRGSPTMEFLRQMFGGNRLPYGQRPDEMEAFQAEKLRRARMGRPQTPVPSFTSGQDYIPQDINLKAPSPQVLKRNGI